MSWSTARDISKLLSQPDLFCLTEDMGDIVEGEWNLVANEVLLFYCILFMIYAQQDALTHN
jgi:hypothetical protein